MSSVAFIDRRSVTDFMRLYQIQNRYDDWYRNRQIVEYTFCFFLSIVFNFCLVEDENISHEGCRKGVKGDKFVPYIKDQPSEAAIPFPNDLTQRVNKISTCHENHREGVKHHLHSHIELRYIVQYCIVIFYSGKDFDANKFTKNNNQ